MASLSVVKLAATVASYGFGLSGGIFAPSLYVGGMLGGALGASLHPWVPQNPNIVGSFALVGMGAFFAGAIRAPITSILIIFEMTGDYAIILPLMIANMISYMLASYWQPVPIYEALLEQDGLHAGDHDVAVFRRTAIDRAMTRRVVTAAPHEPVDAVLRRLDELGVNAFPVVDDAGALVGIVSRKDLIRESAAGTNTDAVMARRVATIFADQTLDAALLRMGRHGIRQLPVVTRGESRALVGIVTLRDISAYARSAQRPTNTA
jgi:CIC family chloride channel protein